MILSASNEIHMPFSYIIRFVMMLDRVYRHNKNQEFTYEANNNNRAILG